MSTHTYLLGPAHKLEQLYPAPDIADPSLNFHDYTDVIRHYTNNSLIADGFQNIGHVTVTKKDGEYHVSVESAGTHEDLVHFGKQHAKIFDKEHAQKAIRGMELLKEFKVWNPMADYHVNNNQNDGLCKWTLFPPLGLNVIGQKGLLLLHYPPWAVPQLGTFDNAITMKRWEQVLMCAGVATEDVSSYRTFIDVNPIAAPGSGQSEYPNDYFPIMMASAFFDGAPDRDYIRSMLELYLTPPGHPEDSKYTLPLLICGSPLYDPQAPGWFRVTYTDILPKDQNGIPQVNVMQVGKFKIHPNSKKETPYLIGNHMIAAGVTGRCTNNAAEIPDIREYEAQDLVAATFLKLYTDNPSLEPEEAKRQACMKWFGNAEGTGAPDPADDHDKQTICALAQMDLFFSPTPKPHPTYTFEEAWARCGGSGVFFNPCAGPIAPPSQKAG
ncbi:MAG TPA: hypothetical protein VLA58_06405 [Chitinophagaceae bacterium]|nr:hypothetical protein [Chitinophagaceae bacterium]